MELYYDRSNLKYKIENKERLKEDKYLKYRYLRKPLVVEKPNFINIDSDGIFYDKTMNITIKKSEKQK